MNKRVITAVVMFTAGAMLSIASAFYEGKKTVALPVETEIKASETKSQDELEAAAEKVFSSEGPRQEMEEENAFVPVPEELNLVHFFPEDTDASDMKNSYAGQIFKTISSLDEEWMALLYSYIDDSPKEFAEKLGCPRSAYLGRYDPEDEEHNPEDPNSWVIHSFKNICMDVTDGDGHPISISSNVIPIMAMANVYSYYHDVKDHEMVLNYMKNLWKQSRSFQISMSDVYYCDGCLTNEEETEFQNAQIESEDVAESTAGVIEETVIEESVIEESVIEESAASNVIVSGHKTKTEDTASASNALLVEHTLEETSLEEAVLEEKQTEPLDYSCPGHVDLHIHVRINGLNEKHSLFELDAADPKTEKTESGSWNGWTEENRTYAKNLAAQDWYEKYGFSLSMITVKKPLTEAEIEAYMSELPESISQTRKDLIHFALSSVGRVPYYWGGKPAAAGYTENNFGTLVGPDEDGRVLKGLDCSGWINWVYWSSIGQRQPYEGTSGLAALGRGIGKKELQPGDILVRTGEHAHVVMFLGWTEDGRIRCIHETSTSNNNVAVSVCDTNWPYYRNLID